MIKQGTLDSFIEECISDFFMRTRLKERLLVPDFFLHSYEISDIYHKKPDILGYVKEAYIIELARSRGNVKRLAINCGIAKNVAFKDMRRLSLWDAVLISRYAGHNALFESFADILLKDSDNYWPIRGRLMPQKFSESDFDLNSNEVLGIFHRLPRVRHIVSRAYCLELRRFNGSVSRYAEHYGKVPQNVYRDLRELGIHKADYQTSKAS